MNYKQIQVSFITEHEIKLTPKATTTIIISSLKKKRNYDIRIASIQQQFDWKNQKEQTAQRISENRLAYWSGNCKNWKREKPGGSGGSLL